MKLIEADKVEQAIKDYWKAQVDRLPRPKSIEEHDAYVNRLDACLEHNSELLKEIEALPSAQPDTTTHDSIPAETGKNDEDRTSGDCISRQQAIDVLEERLKASGYSNVALVSELNRSIGYLMRLPSAQSEQRWTLCSKRMPEEREWIGTKRFGTTISDEVYVTFEAPDGQRFTDHISFQNGKLSRLDEQRMKVIYKGAKPIAWKPLPESYKG